MILFYFSEIKAHYNHGQKLKELTYFLARKSLRTVDNSDVLVGVHWVSVKLFILVCQPNRGLLLVAMVSLRFNSSYEKTVFIFDMVNVIVLSWLVDMNPVRWNGALVFLSCSITAPGAQDLHLVDVNLKSILG